MEFVDSCDTQEWADGFFRECHAFDRMIFLVIVVVRNLGWKVEVEGIRGPNTRCRMLRATCQTIPAILAGKVSGIVPDVTPVLIHLGQARAGSFQGAEAGRGP